MDIDRLTDDIKNLEIATQHGTTPEARLLAYCQTYPPPFDKTSQLIKRFEALIAGSAVVKALIPSSWQPSDIDIFCNEGSSTKGLIQLFLYLGWKEEAFSGSSYNWCTPNCIVEVRELSHSNFRINVVVLTNHYDNLKSLISTIHSTFDLDGCAVCYDGERIHMNPLMKASDFYCGLWTYNFQGLCYALQAAKIPKGRKDYEKVLAFFERVQRRFEKYSQRGIRVVNGFELLSLMIQPYSPK